MTSLPAEKHTHREIQTREIVRRSAFSQWLDRQPPFRRFRRMSNCGCPLSIYSGQYVRIDSYGPTPSSMRQKPLPEWAQEFIRLWDAGVDRGYERGIAATALRIMRSIP